MKNSILILLPKVRSGGAERVLVTLANYWAENQRKVTFLTLEDHPVFYKISDNVNLIQESANNKDGTINSFKRILEMVLKARNQIKQIKPDIVLSFLTTPNILSIISTIRLDVKVVISERSNPLKSSKTNYRWKLLRKYLYQFADIFVVQTLESKQIWENLEISLPPVEIINNPINPKFSNSENSQILKKKIVLSIGRFSTEKGHIKLIKAFSRLKLNGWRLVLIGGGPLETEYKNLISDLKLNGSVILHAYKKNIEQYYSEASIYVLSSEYEGFPNALCEAMCFGCVPISFNCSTGPKEIIEHGVNGILVEQNNVEDLATAIQKCIDSSTLRKKISKEAMKINKKLSVQNISNKWESLFKTI